MIELVQLGIRPIYGSQNFEIYYLGADGQERKVKVKRKKLLKLVIDLAKKGDCGLKISFHKSYRKAQKDYDLHLQIHRYDINGKLQLHPTLVISTAFSEILKIPLKADDVKKTIFALMQEGISQQVSFSSGAQ